MQLLPSDITTRADRNGQQTVWVSERLLVSHCDGLTELYLRKKARYAYAKTVPSNRRHQLIMPDTGAAWRYAKIKGAWYYDLDRIPDLAPTRYRSQLPDKDALLAMHQDAQAESRPNGIETMVKRALKAEWRAFLPAYSGLTQQQAENLAKAAAILFAAIEYASTHNLDMRRLEFFSDLGAEIDRLGVPYLPGNARRLKEKAMRVLGGEAPTEVITLPRMGNSNAKRFDDPQVVAWLMTMRASGANYTATFIARKVATLCALNDKVAPSKSWLEQFMAQHETKFLTHARYGAGGRRAMPWKGYVPMAGAVYAGDCWMMDGTRMNFIEFTEGNDKWAHLVVVMVYDVMSGAFVGRSYGLSENRWLYQDALAKAATQSGYLPYEIVTDRFPGHDTPEWTALTNKLQRSGTRLHVTHKMTGKARMERAIDTVQLVAMQESDKYYGQGVQSRRDFAHRSDEMLASMRRRARAEGWNMQRAIREAEAAFEAYNNTRYSDYARELRRAVDQSPAELHAESEKPHTAQFDWFEGLHLFGYSKRIQVRNQGMIVTEIQKVKYTYVIGVEHYEIIKRHRDVVMYYDLEDLSRVQLFEPADNPADERYLCEALEQQAIQWHGPNRDERGMGQARARIAAIQERAKADLEAMTAGANADDLIGGGWTKNRKEEAETAWLLERAERTRKQPVPVTTGDDEDTELTAADIRSGY